MKNNNELKNALSLNDNCLVVTGSLNFQTVTAIFLESIKLITSFNTVVIDLANVTDSNSAAVSLLIEWIKFAQNKQKKLIFRAIPASLENLFLIMGLKDKFIFNCN